MWIDGFNGIAHHVAQNVDFVVAAAADLPTFRDWARGSRMGPAATPQLR